MVEERSCRRVRVGVGIRLRNLELGFELGFELGLEFRGGLQVLGLAKA